MLCSGIRTNYNPEKESNAKYISVKLQMSTYFKFLLVQVEKQKSENDMRMFPLILTSSAGLAFFQMALGY